MGSGCAVAGGWWVLVWKRVRPTLIPIHQESVGRGGGTQHLESLPLFPPTLHFRLLRWAAPLQKGWNRSWHTNTQKDLESQACTGCIVFGPSGCCCCDVYRESSRCSHCYLSKWAELFRELKYKHSLCHLQKLKRLQWRIYLGNTVKKKTSKQKFSRHLTWVVPLKIAKTQSAWMETHWIWSVLSIQPCRELSRFYPFSFCFYPGSFLHNSLNESFLFCWEYAASLFSHCLPLPVCLKNDYCSLYNNPYLKEFAAVW